MRPRVLAARGQAPAALATGARLRVAVPAGLLAPLLAAGALGSWVATGTLREDTAAGQLRMVPVAASVPSSFSLHGSGFGHGVGLSQYGARAQAAAGRSVTTILASYYSGTSVTSVDDDATVLVQVLGGASSATVRSTALSSSGGTFKVSVGGHTLTGGTKHTLTLSASSKGVKATLKRTGSTTRSYTSSKLTVSWEGTRYLSGGATTVTVSGAGGEYRRGRLDVSTVSGTLNVVARMRLHDEYLAGIGEVPSSWPSAALQAQAILARTYAIRAMASGVRSSCGCHLYDDTRSQVFSGWKKEGEKSGSTSWGARWVAAVKATGSSSGKGKIVTSGGRPIEALYFSSDGGRTENSEDVWSSKVPYLRSVSDPWSLKSGNPMASWTRSVSQSTMAKLFGLKDVASLDLSSRTDGGAVDSAVATSSSGKTAKVSGHTFRSRLSLPSAWLTRSVSRVADDDRYSTGFKVASSVSTKTRTAVLAGGGAVYDEIVAAPLARSLKAPLLLTGRTKLPRGTITMLRSRKVSKVVVVGQTRGVSTTVTKALTSAGITVERITGDDHYAIAAAVAKRMGAPDHTAFVVPGGTKGLAEASAAAALGGALHRPVLYVKSTSVPSSVKAALKSLKVTKTTCVGTTSLISEPTRKALPSCTRIDGVNRYSTSVKLIKAFASSVSPSTLTVVSADPDRLMYAALGAAMGEPVLLVGDRLPDSVADYLQSTQAVKKLQVVGGSHIVPSAVLRALQQA